MDGIRGEARARAGAAPSGDVELGGDGRGSPRPSARGGAPNFPWPEPTSSQRATVERAAQQVLSVREGFSDRAVADLYDPLAMPKELFDAHCTLDRDVERCYRSSPFASNQARVEYLFSLYERLSDPLLADGGEPQSPRPVRRRAAKGRRKTRP